MCSHMPYNTIRSHSSVITIIPFALKPIQSLSLNIFTNTFDIILNTRVRNKRTGSQMIFIDMMLKFITFNTLIRTVLVMTFVWLFACV